jgi:hypothetical protein
MKFPTSHPLLHMSRQICINERGTVLQVSDNFSVLVVERRKVTGPHYDPEAFVNAFEIPPIVGYLWLVRLC